LPSIGLFGESTTRQVALLPIGWPSGRRRLFWLSTLFAVLPAWFRSGATTRDQPSRQALDNLAEQIATMSQIYGESIPAAVAPHKKRGAAEKWSTVQSPHASAMRKGRFMKLGFVCLLAGMAVLSAAWTGGIARAQQGDAPNGNASALRFEVTSVKEIETMPPPSELAGIRAMAGGAYIGRYVTLKSMIREMYKITDVQIAGGPNWINTARFDITGKAAHPDNIGNFNIMFQNMLADRFKLQFHRETRTLPVWVVTMDKNGSKMKINPSPEQSGDPIKLSGAGAASTSLTFAGSHTNMEYLCWWLGLVINRFQQVDRPVVDRTGLKGFYDFTLTFEPDPSGRTGPNGEPLASFEGSNLAEALREQLGLNLESAKNPVLVFIIDHVEKPSEN
jgi:uncharacterized protein (TIGR03435 family)